MRDALGQRGREEHPSYAHLLLALGPVSPAKGHCKSTCDEVVPSVSCSRSCPPVLVLTTAYAAQGKYAAFGRINIRVDLSFEGLGMRLRTKDITVLESVSGALPCHFVDARVSCVLCVGPFPL